MDFDWTDEQLRLRADAVAFGAEALSAEVGDDDRLGRFPREKWERLAAWGYLGLGMPAEYGGAGVDPMTALLVTEGLAEGCTDTGLLFSAVVQGWVVGTALMRFGSTEQKKEFLPRLADGSLIGSFAVSEAESGSDAFALQARAVAHEDGWRLSGRKAWVTNGPVADLLVCFASTGARGFVGGVSAFLVDAGADGVSRAPAAEKMGLRTSPLGDVVLDDVFVPRERLLGRAGRASAIFNEVLEWERIWPMAVQVGVQLRELRESRAYALDRQSFGVPIAKHQAVAHRLVEMNMRTEAGRLLLYRAAALKAQGRKATAESALAKLWLSEGAVQNSLDSVHVHGAYGYMTDAGIERRVRDAVGSRIYSGTSEMQRGIIAAEMGL